MDMSDLSLSVRLLLLLGAANVAPIAAKRVFGARWSWPLDGGLRLFDGRPLLGPTKTVRGLMAAVVGAGLAAVLLGLPAGLGVAVGALAILGDALSSFSKRRLGVAPSGRATGLPDMAADHGDHPGLLRPGDPVVPPDVPASAARSALLSGGGAADQPRDRRCRVISGRQFRRTSTIEEPQPTEV
jgi:hypothetical protein